MFLNLFYSGIFNVLSSSLVLKAPPSLEWRSRYAEVLWKKRSAVNHLTGMTGSSDNCFVFVAPSTFGHFRWRHEVVPGVDNLLVSRWKRPGTTPCPEPPRPWDAAPVRRATDPGGRASPVTRLLQGESALPDDENNNQLESVIAGTLSRGGGRVRLSNPLPFWVFSF